MAGEAVVFVGASKHNVQALHALDSWTRAPRLPPFVPLDATLALDSDASWRRQALPPRAERLRDAVETLACEPAAAAAHAGNVEGWLQPDRLCQYRRGDGPGAALPRGRCPDRFPARRWAPRTSYWPSSRRASRACGGCREMQGRLEEAAETFEAAGMPAAALRLLARRRQAGAGPAAGGGTGA